YKAPPGSHEANRHAPSHSRPPDRTSIRAFPNNVRLLHSTESSAKRPHRPSSSFHVRTPPGQTTDARDKELPVPRSCGCYVVELYNESRTHLALEKDAPLRRAIQRCGAIITTPILSGLHHRYVRI